MVATILLEDIEDKSIDAVFIYKGLIYTLEEKRKELQELIDKVKASREDWNLEDIRDALPSEWELVTRWDDEWAVVSY